SVRFDVRSDIPKDPYNYYFEEGYDVVVPQRTWGKDEGERKENFQRELCALEEKKNSFIPSEEIQVKISTMFSKLHVIVSQNRFLPFYIEKYFMLPVKLYLHLQEKLEEVSLLFDRDENKQVEYFVKAKLLENIKDHLKTTKTVAGFFCAYKIAIDSLGLTPFSEFTSPLYSDLVPDDVNNSKYFKKYIYAEIVKDVLAVAVIRVVWSADFAKPALPISKKGVDFEREIFFDVLSRSQNRDTSNIWKLVNALTIANNFLLPKEKQRQPHEHLLFILGMDKSDSFEFGFTISPANAESLLQVFLPKNSNNSFNITKDSLEKSFLYTVKKLSKHQFTGDNWVFHSANAFLEDQIFLSKLKEEFQKKNLDFSFILDVEEPIDSCVSFFRVLGRSHKSDLAGRDGNTKRLKTILAILKEHFDIIPKDVKEAFFTSKTKEQMTHFDLLAYATLGDVSAQGIVSSIERSTLYQNLIYLYSEENQAYLDGKDPKSGWNHQDSGMDQMLKNIERSSVNLKKCKILANRTNENTDIIFTIYDSFSAQPQQSWQDFQAMLRDACKPTALFSLFASPRAEFHKVLLLETCTMESLLAKIEADLADPKKRQEVIDLFAPLGLVSCEGDIVTGSVPKKVEVVADPMAYRSVSTLGAVRH
ncbi:MAG: hypothetical protein NTU49_11205, partial [Gammaproteobacteria bacterium]|nr:hypothetical protein [Gammaproteobacteria bacterium]